MISRLVNLVDAFYRFRGTTWQENLQNICSRLHIPLLAHIVEVLLFKNLKIWEAGVSSLLSNTNGKLFVDIGACYGRYTVLLGKKYKQIIAIEPEPRNMWIMRCNVNYAHLKNVQFLQCAVSDRNGYCYMYLGKRPDWHTLCVPLKKGKLKVKTLTLSQILRDCDADLVKVDVEGAEWLVLRGAEPVVDKIQSWVVELHDLKRKKELEEWFISHGYFVQWIEPFHIFAWKELDQFHFKFETSVSISNEQGATISGE